MTITHVEGMPPQDPDRPEPEIEIEKGTTVFGWKLERQWYLIQIPRYGIVSWVSRDFYYHSLMGWPRETPASLPTRAPLAPLWWLLVLAAVMFAANQRWLW